MTNIRYDRILQHPKRKKYSMAMCYDLKLHIKENMHAEIRFGKDTIQEIIKSEITKFAPS